jgi:hypothetical protein
MKDHNHDDGSKKVKNIAAVIYVLAMVFLVGGSYLNQRQGDDVKQASSVNASK